MYYVAKELRNPKSHPDNHGVTLCPRSSVKVKKRKITLLFAYNFT